MENNQQQSKQKDWKTKLFQTPLTPQEKVKQKENIYLKPITKKKLVVKLIPFMFACLIVLGLFLACFITPSFLPSAAKAKAGLYALGPILLVVLSPFVFWFFDRPYCQYNLKHNEKMKKILGKMFVKPVSDNQCFRLRQIYMANPNQIAWFWNGEKIIYEYRKWNPDAYEADIKYFKEMAI